MRTLVVAAAAVLIVGGAVLAFEPFRGSLVRDRATRSVQCGTPARAVGDRDTREQLNGLARLSRSRSAVGRPAPSARDVARYNRLVREADHYVACRGEAARRMAVADVMIFAGLVAIVVGLWRRHDDRLVSTPVVT